MEHGNLMIFDTASLYFRAYFGLPSSLRSPDGRQINAVKGLLDFIASLTASYSPTHLACAWDDAWRPSWRVRLVPSYKAHRLADPASGAEEVPPELTAQVPLIRECLDALGIPIIGAPDHEADDVLASLAAASPRPSLVVTGDRDLFQLAALPGVRIVYVARGVARHELIDDEQVRAKYGVPASRYVDFAVLRGDPSDGLPGVKGIGEKSAAMLAERYASLEEMVAAASDPGSSMGPAVRRKLAGSLDYLAAAREVVTAVTEAPIDGEPVAVGAATIDRERFDSLAEELGLGGTAGRVLAALGAQEERSR